jgi:hypothetical protein
MGKPSRANHDYPNLVLGSEPAEVKHLSKRRKKKKQNGLTRMIVNYFGYPISVSLSIPLVVASERGRA